MDCCIVVADGARARFFTAKVGEGGGTEEFQEREDLVEPERAVADRQLYSDKSGQNRPGSGVEDHRVRHREEVERRFAKRIVEVIARLIATDGPDSLVVVAEPRLLGVLRAPMWASLPRELPRTEVGADLTRQSVHELQRALESYGILPARVRPTRTSRAS